MAIPADSASLSPTATPQLRDDGVDHAHNAGLIRLQFLEMVAQDVCPAFGGAAGEAANECIHDRFLPNRRFGG